ncbi:MAG: helix-turn-helix domain-containing protein, partial [Candidatus Levybacteria bacterium]|nr:helix-turn-helix domain-containing protein [Candidatus Levybacteria bacterium]
MEFSARQKLNIIEEAKTGIKITLLCKKYNISRFTFYKWQNRYKKASSWNWQEALSSQKAKGHRHWKYIPFEKQKLVLNLVSSHPEYSIHWLYKILKGEIGYYGIQNILVRNKLNTYQRRLAYANEKIKSSIVTGTQKTSDFKIPSFISFSFISVIPPPLRRIIISSSKVFILSFISAVFLIFLFKVILNTGSIGSSIGTLLSLTSFTFGMFFFLYSFKYYVTIAAVLSFSRQKDEALRQAQGGSESFFSKLFARVTNRNK